MFALDQSSGIQKRAHVTRSGTPVAQRKWSFAEVQARMRGMC